MQHTGFTGSILRKLPGTASKVWLIALALLLCLPLGTMPARADAATDNGAFETDSATTASESNSSEKTANRQNTPSVEDPGISYPPPPTALTPAPIR